MKQLFLVLTLLLSGCAEKKPKLAVIEADSRVINNVTNVPPLFTGNPNNYEVVEANGLYAISKGAYLSPTFTTCEEATRIAKRMNDFDSMLDTNAKRALIENETRRQLPWKRVDCGQESYLPGSAHFYTNRETEILTNGTNVYASLTNQPEFTLSTTNALEVGYSFDFKPTDSFFQMSTNGEMLIDIHMDGTVVMSNTNLDDLSKRFWFHVGEIMPSVMEQYCAYLTNRSTK